MEKQQKDVTIKDVARRADVAISTVSRVLNGLDKVRPQTRERVWEAVRELGYVPNSLAVSMVTGQTKAVMVVVPDFTNDFNGAVVQGAEIEIACFVRGPGGGQALLIRLEKEKLAFRAHIEGVTHAQRLLQNALERAARIADEGRAIGMVYVANQPGDLARLRPPGQNRIAVQIGAQVLVGFVDAHKALDGAAVDHDLVVHGLFNLGRGDGHVLQLTEDVRKLHADELHISLPHQADDLFLAAHRKTTAQNKK